MAKKNSPTPAPSGPAKMSFGRKVLVFIILLIILTFLLDALGVPIVNRSEDTKMLEHPHR